jgi:hypothetical protein
LKYKELGVSSKKIITNKYERNRKRGKLFSTTCKKVFEENENRHWQLSYMQFKGSMQGMTSIKFIHYFACYITKL